MMSVMLSQRNRLQWWAGALLGLSVAGALPAAKVDLNNPTGKTGVIMIDKLGTHVRFFDPATWKETANIEVGMNPHDFVLSADHKTAYIPIYGDGIYGRNPHPGHEVVIVDMAGKKQVGSIDVSPYMAPHGIQIDAAGMLYVTCDLSRKILVIDPKTRKIVAAIDNEGTGHWIGILPDGSKLYVTNKKDKPYVSVIDLKARKIVARVPAPGGTEGIAVSPDGKRVVVMDSSLPEMMVIDPATDTVIDRVKLKDNEGGSYKVKYSLDGSKILTMTLRGGFINLLNASDLHGEQKVLKVGKDPMGFAFSPDDKTLLVANHGDGSVSVVNLKEWKVVNQFHAGTGIETLSYY
jgi:YVTN family beta-propeller protein